MAYYNWPAEIPGNNTETNSLRIRSVRIYFEFKKGVTKRHIAIK